VSLILEALRKSEAERRRGQAPTLSSELPPLATRQPGRLAPWIWIAGALAVLLAVAWWLASDHAAPDTIVAPVAEPAASAAPTAPLPTLPQPPAGAVSPGAAAFPPVERIAPPPARTPSVVAQPSAPIPAPAERPTAASQPSAEAAVAPPATPAPAPTPATTAIRPPATTADSARTPSVAELPAGERSQLPALKLSMHMWNPQPAQRFVILDGTRYGEGDRVGPATITAIDTDGVVLDLNGRAVRLPLR
jgi:general secretion pathway protein B